MVIWLHCPKIVEATDWCLPFQQMVDTYITAAPFAKMTNKEIEFVVAHEILHCVYDHMTRVKTEIPRYITFVPDYIETIH